MPPPPAFTLSTRVQQVAQCACQVMDGETIVIVPKERVVHLLNETGSEIWSAIAEPRKVGEVVERICREFEVEQDAAQRDVMEFLSEMASKKLIQVVADA